ncbi:MAG: hypothetical protein WKG52_09825 [Variovorax sp.]
MSSMWNFAMVGLLAVAAAALVVFGEPASAELKLAEAASAVAAVGAIAVFFLAAPAAAALAATPD